MDEPTIGPSYPRPTASEPAHRPGQRALGSASWTRPRRAPRGIYPQDNLSLFGRCKSQGRGPAGTRKPGRNPGARPGPGGRRAEAGARGTGASQGRAGSRTDQKGKAPRRFAGLPYPSLPGRKPAPREPGGGPKRAAAGPRAGAKPSQGGGPRPGPDGSRGQTKVGQGFGFGGCPPKAPTTPGGASTPGSRSPKCGHRRPQASPATPPGTTGPPGPWHRARHAQPPGLRPDRRLPKLHFRPSPGVRLQIETHPIRVSEPPARTDPRAEKIQGPLPPRRNTPSQGLESVLHHQGTDPQPPLVGTHRGGDGPPKGPPAAGSVPVIPAKSRLGSAAHDRLTRP